MKLLKKIAPIAGILLMTGLTFGAATAAELGTWKANFPSASTSIVVGTGHNDAIAMTEIASEIGITAATTTVTGESYKFEKTRDHLNLGENFYHIKERLTKNELPTILADKSYEDADGNTYDYTQKISIANGNSLTHFKNDDYKDGALTLGFELNENDPILNYTLSFVEKPDFDNDTLETTVIEMMGREYYISSIDATADSMTFLEAGQTATVYEGETASIGGKSVKLVTVYPSGDTYKAVLEIDGTETRGLKEGGTQKVGSVYVGVLEIRYNSRETGRSSARISIGSGEIVIKDGEEVKISEKSVDNLFGHIDTSSDKLNSITLEWLLEEDAFLGSGDEIVLPGFKNIKLMMTEMVFPTGEQIKVGYSGTKKALLKVPIESGTGTSDVVLLEGDGTTWNYLGESSKPLKVTNESEFTGLTKKDRFFATYMEEEEGQSYYLYVYGFDEDKDTVTFKSVDGSSSCTVSDGDDCTFGQVSFKVAGLDAEGEEVNITAADDVYFDRIVSKAGALFWLPNTIEGNEHYINLTVSNSWDLVMSEKDEDGNIGDGKEITFALKFADAKATVGQPTATWAGGDMLEQDDDTDVGYVESPLATKVVYETGGDQDYADVTYFGEEVYGNVYIAGAGTTTSGEGSVAILDTEFLAGPKTNNVVLIGGSGVNKASAQLLFNSQNLVYGSDPAWVAATGVDSVGKALVKLQASPWATGKYALLVAGFEATDTLRAARLLTTTPSALAGKTTALLNTGTEEATLISGS
ncbi:MAG: hypothetical protein QXP53_00965 [Candidatus Pacearchaeota archaeon]